jgi:hypothetical protein
VLKIDGVELIGINNRNIGTVVRQRIFIQNIVSEAEAVFVYANFVLIAEDYYSFAETMVLDTSNTRMVMEKRGDIIREKGIMVCSLNRSLVILIE